MGRDQCPFTFTREKNEKLLACDVFGGQGFSSTLVPQITAQFNRERLR